MAPSERTLVARAPVRPLEPRRLVRRSPAGHRDCDDSMRAAAGSRYALRRRGHATLPATRVRVTTFPAAHTPGRRRLLRLGQKFRQLGFPDRRPGVVTVAACLRRDRQQDEAAALYAFDERLHDPELTANDEVVLGADGQQLH